MGGLLTNGGVRDIIRYMKAGLIADLIVAVFVVIVVAVYTKRGLLRSVLGLTSTLLALLIAYFACSPLAGFLDKQFTLVEKIANWHVPFLTPETLLRVMTFVGLFIVARLLFIMLDKFLKYIKEKIKAVNVTDRVLGFVFGLVMAAVYLTAIFMVIDWVNLTTVAQLTKDSGGYFAPYLFAFLKEHVFPLVGVVFGAVSDLLPKI